jgi:hypothetical protein
MASWLAPIGGHESQGLQNRNQELDAEGNSYISGSFFGTATVGSSTLVSSGERDGYLAKYASDGEPQWAIRYGGSDIDYPFATDLDDAGQFIYAIGKFRGTADFGNGFVLTSDGSTYQDEFILKVNAATGATVWAKRLGGAGVENLMDVAAGINPATNTEAVFLTGDFNSTIDFDPGPGTVLRTPTAVKGKTMNSDLFVLTLDVNGNYQSVWQFGGKDTELANAIILDGDSFILQGGFQGTTDFDPGPGTVTRTSTLDRRTPTTDFFLARYSISGALDWVQTIGNSGIQNRDSINIELAGDSLYLTGYFKGALDFDPGPGSALLTSSNDSFDGVVAKYSKLDGSYVWANRYGGPGDDNAPHSVVDEATGMLYVGGRFAGAVDFNLSGAGGELSANGTSDGYLLKLDSKLGSYQHVWQVSGQDAESAQPIGVLHTEIDGASQSTLIVTGGFRGTATFPTGATLTSSGAGDVFVMALDEGVQSSPIINSLLSAKDIDLALLAITEEWSTTSTTRRAKKR